MNKSYKQLVIEAIPYMKDEFTTFDLCEYFKNKSIRHHLYPTRTIRPYDIPGAMIAIRKDRMIESIGKLNFNRKIYKKINKKPYKEEIIIMDPNPLEFKDNPFVTEEHTSRGPCKICGKATTPWFCNDHDRCPACKSDFFLHWEEDDNNKIIFRCMNCLHRWEY